MVGTTCSTAHLASVTKVGPLGLGAYSTVWYIYSTFSINNRNNLQCNAGQDYKHKISKSLLKVITLGSLHIWEW
jgi:hypothetical protein